MDTIYPCGIRNKCELVEIGLEMSEDTAADSKDLVSCAASIISAYVGHNAISPQDLPTLIASVHAALKNLGVAAQAEVKPELSPAVPIKKSVTSDFIICLEDGKKFKSLKRHLMTHFKMTPDDYRTKWNLPNDYPMVAPAYAAVRSGLARANGLGRKAEGAPARRKKASAAV